MGDIRIAKWIIKKIKLQEKVNNSVDMKIFEENSDYDSEEDNKQTQEISVTLKNLMLFYIDL